MEEWSGVYSLSLPSLSPSIVSSLRRTELDSRFRFGSVHGNVSLARNLKRCGELKGHTGCVNRLSFSPDASMLASASDDAHVCLWDTATHELRVAVPTGHVGNIFGVRFIPETGLSRVASGGLDTNVRVTDVESPHTSRAFACHEDRVKTVEVDQTTPSVIISASEDGTARLFDIRERTRSGEPGAASNSDVLVRIPDCQNTFDSRGLKSACLNPVDSHQLLVAADSVRIFDRRTLSSSMATPSGPEAAVAELLPHHLRADAPERATSASSAGVQVLSTFATFSDDGSKVVASFCGDAVYVFDAVKSSSKALNVYRAPGHCGGLLQQRVNRLLDSARQSVLDRAYSDAICSVNDVLRIDKSNVVALHVRCEAYLSRGWVFDHRSALADADRLRRLVGQSPEAVQSIISASTGARQSGESSLKCDSEDRCVKLWNAAIELQRAKAISGIVVPRGRLVLSTSTLINPLPPEKDLEVRRRLRLATAVVDKLEDDVHRLLEMEFGGIPQGASVSLRTGKRSSFLPFYDSCLRNLDSRMRGIREICTETQASLASCRKRHKLTRDRAATSNMSRRRHAHETPSVSRSAGTQDPAARAYATGGVEATMRNARLDGRGEHEGSTRAAESGDEEEYRNVVERANRAHEGEDELRAVCTEPVDFEQSMHCSDEDEDANTPDGGGRRRRQNSVGSVHGEACKRSRSDWDPEVVVEDDEETAGIDYVRPASDNFWRTVGDDILGYRSQMVGHFNAHTDIKEASFYGPHCILGGSDDGHVYVWDAATGRLLARLLGDRDIVNCVQAAPWGAGGGLVATSGIDHDVKLWRPFGSFDQSALFQSAVAQERCFVENYEHGAKLAARVDINIDALRSGLFQYHEMEYEGSEPGECPVS